MLGIAVAILAGAAALAVRPVAAVVSSAVEFGAAHEVAGELARLRGLVSSLPAPRRFCAAACLASEPAAQHPVPDLIWRSLGELKGRLGEAPEQRSRLEELARLAVAEAQGDPMVPAAEENGSRREMAALLEEMEQAAGAREARADAELRSSLPQALSFAGAAALAALLVALAALNLAQRQAAARRSTEDGKASLLLMAEQAGELVTIADPKGRIELVNKAVEEVTGYSREELLGRRSASWFPWYAGAPFLDELKATVLSGRPYRAAVMGRRKTGESFMVEEVVTPLTDPSGKVTRIVSTSRDVTREHVLEDTLDYLDQHDALTDLPNRKGFAELLEREVRVAGAESRSLAILVLDVDRFTHLNNLFGHEVGDGLLQKVAERLRSAVGPEDVVARLGADEFAVIHRGEASQIDASGAAERIQQAVSSPIRVRGHEFGLTVTTGMAVYPDDGADAQTLLGQADLALGRARTKGRNTVQRFDRSIARGAAEFFLLEKRLFGALGKGEYQVLYQPYFDLARGKVMGAEALIQWNNCDLGAVPPARFIPLLEETGMIVDVGRWVLETACRQMGAWQANARPLPISVNLSLAQFRHKQLVSMVSEAIEASRLEPGQLTLEVTESIFVQDLDYAVRTLKRLKEVGVSISVDDFGTGYSSLSYLKKLPVDVIKIDISFVRDVTQDQDAASIIAAITTLARGLNLRTIAEGVETEAQRNILHLLRCDMGQGFYFSRAVRPAEMEDLLARERDRTVEA